MGVSTTFSNISIYFLISYILISWYSPLIQLQFKYLRNIEVHPRIPHIISLHIFYLLEPQFLKLIIAFTYLVRVIVHFFRRVVFIFSVTVDRRYKAGWNVYSHIICFYHICKLIVFVFGNFSMISIKCSHTC